MLYEPITLLRGFPFAHHPWEPYLHQLFEAFEPILALLRTRDQVDRVLEEVCGLEVVQSLVEGRDGTHALWGKLCPGPVVMPWRHLQDVRVPGRAAVSGRTQPPVPKMAQ